jgi:hypothetical protein
MKWERAGYGEEIYVADDGRVLGRVSTGYRTATAHINGKHVEFNNEANARKHVEKELGGPRA